MKKQIELLKKYDVTNYTIKNKQITINGWLDLRSLTTADKDFLRGTTINGSLYLSSLTTADKDFLQGTTINGGLDLRSLTTADKDFLRGTTINGSLYLRSLTTADKDFLQGTTINGGLDLSSLTTADKDFLRGTTINGWLDLSSLTTADKDFLQGTTINGWLDLSSLTTADKDICRNNVKKLQVGYNKEKGYCFFDNILSKVLSVSTKKGITIYTTPSEFIAQKGDFTAHGKTIKKAIEDLQFKMVAEKLKNEPINADTMISMAYYRVVTGSCSAGIESWVKANNLTDLSEIKAKDLLPILKRTNAYGLDRFKKLINF